MYIIADIEWVENKMNKQSPTQLSAIRVDADWNIVDEFSAFIRPMDSSFHDWNHVAYYGGTPEDFLYAKGCYNVLDAFEKWLAEDEIICWWYKPSRDLYTKLNRIVLKNSNQRSTVILSEYMLGFLDGQGHVKGSAYKLAKARNIEVPEVEHNSYNDVIAIINLLKGVSFPQEALKEPPIKPEPKYNHPKSEQLEYQYDVTNKLLHKKGCPKLPEDVDTLGYSTLNTCIRKGYKTCACVREEFRQAKRDKVIDEINRSQYTFMYAEGGKVFHRYDCHLLQNANHVLGAIKYETIAKKGLRPCKVCNPSPNDLTNPLVAKLNVKKMLAPSKKKKVQNWLTRSEMTAMTRLEQSQKERFSGVLQTEMTPQERADLFTLTQPRFAFFAARGYRNFHLRNCTRFEGRSDIRGFATYAKAKRAGYTPCRHCKPTDRFDIKVSIPIDNKVRTDETIEDLMTLCVQYEYEYRAYSGCFELETPVGKWRIDTTARPVTVEHLNLVKHPSGQRYHTQHRIFLSMLDALKYIHKHDNNLIHGIETDDESEEES